MAMKFILFLSLLFLFGSNQNATKVSSKNWENEVKKSIVKLEYEIRDSKNNQNHFEATNRKRNLRSKISATNFELTPRVKDQFKINYELKSIDKGQSSIDLNSFDHFKNKNKLTFSNESVEIRYLNNENGIRQDFYVKRKPEGSKNLKVELQVSSPFKLKSTDSLVAHMRDGKIVVSYENLLVTDADGKKLNAKFSLNKNLVSILVNDQAAKYPILIDPLSTSPTWSAEQNQADAAFGYTMAYVGDTNGDTYGDVIVGAPFFDSGLTDQGKVFLFKGSATGLESTPSWSYVCTKANCQLGYSLDGAGKVNNDAYYDFVIGAPYYTNGQTNEGAVFIFHGSATGPAATPNRTIESNIANAKFGMSVSGGAKFNSDKYSDIAVGAPTYSVDHTNQGAVFVYWGSASGITTTVRNTIKSSVAYAQMGSTVKVLGDVNGDGYSDLIISSPSEANGQANEGRVRLYHASASGLSNTAVWTGEINVVDAYLGETIAAADINHDGKTDLIVGAPRYTNTYTAQGAVFVYYSNGVSFGSSPDVSFYGQSDWEYFGGGLQSGDINGDSFAEVIVSALLYDGTNTDEGKVYIFYGTSYGVETTARWTKVGGSNEAWFGQAIAVGDINGDATPDLLISSAYESNGETYEGKIYEFRGIQRGLNTVYAQRFNVSQASSQFGFSVAAAGDVNGDSYDDLIVGAYNYDNGQTNEGRAFLFYGTSTGLNTTPAWTYENNQASATLGYAVDGNCDVNNDGYKDVIIGSNLFDNGQTNEGRAYVFHGSSSGLPATPNWTTESNKTSAQYGKAVACAGDVNNDNYDDVLIGAPNFQNTLANEGKVFLYKGSATGLSTTAAWSFVGAQNGANAGTAVSSAKDTNNDGYDDIIIGAPNYDNTLTNEGAAFVFLGTATNPAATPNWTKYGGVASALYGWSVSYAKKLNNDNYGDIIIGAPGYKKTLTAEGGVFIYYGSATGPESTFLAAYGGQTSANFGRCVRSAGDVDGDGYNEVIVSAPLYDNGQTNEGATYIFMGSTIGVSLTSSWKVEGNLASAQFGYSIAGDFDINNDGYDDVVVGAPVYKITNTGDGALFTYFGSGN